MASRHIIQIITEAPVPDNYLCEYVGEPTSPSLHSGFEDWGKRLNNAFVRKTFYTSYDLYRHLLLYAVDFGSTESDCKPICPYRRAI